MFKKALAVVLSAAMVLGMATMANAEKVMTDGINDGYSKVDDGTGFTYDVGALCEAKGVDINNVGGIKLTFTVSSLDAGFGGGIIFNTSTAGAAGSNWNSVEWGNADAAKPISAVEEGDMTFSITRMDSLFGTTADDYGTYNNVCVQSWWGADLDFTAIDVLDANGAVLCSSPAAAEETPATGSVAPVMVVALVAVASTAVIVASKKRA